MPLGFWDWYVLMGNLWVCLHQRASEQEHRYVFNSDKCVVAPCTQVEVLVDVSRPTWHNTDLWVPIRSKLQTGWWWRGHYLGPKTFVW